jgi:uncharacterized protein YidB (DUF937 family)
VDGLSSVQLNVASLGASQLTSTQSWRAHSHPAMDAAATALGMSASDLRTALQSGQSLASIASSKGISEDTLTAAMAAAIEQANPSISADQATKVATAIATRTPPAGSAPAQTGDSSSATQATTGTTTGTTATSGHHHHHHHHAMSTAMDATAQLLGTTTTDLATSLQSGQTLAQIASSKGVSQDDLVKAISSALQQADSNLSADQATQMATTLATGTPPAGQSQPWATGTANTSSTYNVLA